MVSNTAAAGRPLRAYMYFSKPGKTFHAMKEYIQRGEWKPAIGNHAKHIKKYLAMTGKVCLLGELPEVGHRNDLWLPGRQEQ